MTRWPPRPVLSDSFYKAHGLGNDYLVFEEGEGWPCTPDNVRRVCDRHRGVGSDGIVVLLAGAPTGSGPRVEVSLRMFNPDGGEFERSGNGLRVLGSYLALRRPGLCHIDVLVGGDRVTMTLHGRDGPVHDISVAMGRATIGPEAVGLDPAAASRTDAPGRSGDTGSGSRRGAWKVPGPDGDLLVVPVSIGNPHLVVLANGADEVSEERLAVIGPFLATHGSLREGANVQIAWADGRHACRALIWERGVGRTEASGTSACAVATAMTAVGLAEPGAIRVAMPGGDLSVSVSPELDVVLRGPVEEVLEGALSSRLLSTFERGP
jgi:diaminopimelate epimerase